MITMLALTGAFVVGVFVGLGLGRVFCDWHHNSRVNSRVKQQAGPQVVALRQQANHTSPDLHNDQH